MVKSISIVHKVYLALTLLLSFKPAILAQEENTIDQIITLAEVKADFQRALEGVESDSDTIAIYFNHITRLVGRGNYSLADSILGVTFKDFEKLNDTTLIIELKKQRAFMYKAQRRFAKALEDYLWLKDYYEGKNSKNELVEIYSLIAEYYRTIPNFVLMKKHLDLAREIINSTPIDTRTIAFWAGRNGSWFTEYGGNSDSTLFYARMSMALAKESGDLYTEALAANEIGFSYLNRNEPRDSILSYLYRSKNLLLADERYRDYVQTMNNIVQTLNDPNPTEAVNILELIIPMEEENNWYSPLVQSLYHARYQYDKLGQFDKSDEAMHKIYEARIGEINTENEIKVNDLALTYQNQLTEKELEVQEQRAQLAESEAKNNLRAFSIAAIIAFFLGIISIIAIIVNRKFRRKNRLLSLRKETIETANSELQKSLNQQKVLYKELNHRVKNNLTVLTGLIYLQEMDESDEVMRDSMKKLRNRIKSMALAHESLYNTESNGKINFAAYLEALFDELKNALTKEQIVKTEIDCPNFELEIKHAIPLAMIMNELFTNSIKHGFRNRKKGLISIKGDVTYHQVLIHYRDNGSGYSSVQKQNLGLRLVELLLEQIDAKVEDKTTENGFYISLYLPLAEKQKRAS